MQNRKPKFIIISGFLASLSGFENETRHTTLGKGLKGLELKFKPLIGYYKGEREKSFLITYETDKEKRALLGLANHYGQECVLVGDESRDCALVYTKGKNFGSIENIGRIREVNENELQGIDSYSYCPTTNRYYTTENVNKKETKINAA